MTSKSPKAQGKSLKRAVLTGSLLQKSLTKPLNKSILDLSEGAESGAELAPDLIRGPDSATLHQALAC